MFFGTHMRHGYGPEVGPYPWHPAGGIEIRIKMKIKIKSFFWGKKWMRAVGPTALNTP
jgi:hypothetical protein